MPEDGEEQEPSDDDGEKPLRRCRQILDACLGERKQEVLDLLRDLALEEALEAVECWLQARDAANPDNINEGNIMVNG